MKKDLIFFGKDGLTSTSANHVANIAKEALQSIEASLNNVTLMSIDIGLLTSESYKRIQNSASEGTIATIPEQLMVVSKYKSLIAWLREAISARTRLLEEISSTTVPQYCAITGKTYPDSPVCRPVMTKDDWLGTLSVAERNRYFALETECAVIGKYIHPDGVFANQRKSMSTKAEAPYEIIGTGTETILRKYEIENSVKEAANNVFFQLQAQHREKQKEFNRMLFACEEACQKDNADALAELQIKSENFKAELKQITAEYDQWRLEQEAFIKSLKIIIPDDLQEIYNVVKSFSK